MTERKMDLSESGLNMLADACQLLREDPRNNYNQATSVQRLNVKISKRLAFALSRDLIAGWEAHDSDRVLTVDLTLHSPHQGELVEFSMASMSSNKNGCAPVGIQRSSNGFCGEHFSKTSNQTPIGRMHRTSIPVIVTPSPAQSRPSVIMCSDLKGHEESLVLSDKYLSEMMSIRRHSVGDSEDLDSTGFDDVLADLCAEDTSSNSSPANNREQLTPEEGSNKSNSNQLIQLGPCETKISKAVYDKINWNKYSSAVRHLLMAVFSRDVLATHSLSGKPSPAFLDRPRAPKFQLSPSKVSDIIHVVKQKCTVHCRDIRTTITQKCADEHKMLKIRKSKLKVAKKIRTLTEQKNACLKK